MSIAEKVATLMANQPTYADQRIAELEAYNATRTDELVAAAGRIATLEQQNAELAAALGMLIDLHDAAGMPAGPIRNNAQKTIAKVKQP